MKHLLFVCLASCGLTSLAQYNSRVQAALGQTATNQAELKKAIGHFYRSGDSLKIKSINFLVEHMPIHNTYTYYWADKNGKRVDYNELGYRTFNDAVIAFNALKAQHGELHPVAYAYRDIDSMKAGYLIDNVEQACKVWRSYRSTKKGASISERDFYEYILPYRVDVEAVTNWRDIYGARFKNSFTGNFYNDSIRLRQYINDNFKNLYNIENRTEPLPRLSALQILLRQKGYCEDMADMAVFAARSQGVPATIDNVPAWATSTGRHFTNYMHADDKRRHFDAALDSMIREPGKVVRTTYSQQPDAVASWLDSSQIPPGFLRLKNYKDVTHEYWQTGDFTINLFPNATTKAVYVGVMNNGNLVPIWYAKKQGNRATFKNMSKGVVYFPFYFENHKAVAAGHPFALGYKNSAELKPDQARMRKVVIKEQEKYLKYRALKKYQLLIWDNQWKKHSELLAPEGCTQLVFDNVPHNALLLLRPEYSQGKERPFIILENGERVWW